MSRWLIALLLLGCPAKEPASLGPGVARLDLAYINNGYSLVVVRASGDIFSIRSGKLDRDLAELLNARLTGAFRLVLCPEPGVSIESDFTSLLKFETVVCLPDRANCPNTCP